MAISIKNICRNSVGLVPMPFYLGCLSRHTKFTHLTLGVAPQHKSKNGINCQSLLEEGEIPALTGTVNRGVISYTIAILLLTRGSVAMTA